MKMPDRQWIAVLLLLPVIAYADEPAKPATSSTARTPASFNLKDAAVQNIVRATASDNFHAVANQESVGVVNTLNEKLGDIRFRAPRRLHHTECDAFDCTAYTADDQPLYSFPRQQMSNRGDDWLSCQSGNDLLTTFERYDECRGVRVGQPPLRVGGVELRLPKIRL
jgi:hypothetical protein